MGKSMKSYLFDFTLYLRTEKSHLTLILQLNPQLSLTLLILLILHLPNRTSLKLKEDIPARDVVTFPEHNSLTCRPVLPYDNYLNEQTRSPRALSTISQSDFIHRVSPLYHSINHNCFWYLHVIMQVTCSHLNGT